MALSNRERIGRVLEALKEGLVPFILREYRTVYTASGYVNEIDAALSTRSYPGLPRDAWSDESALRAMLDTQACLNLLVRRWSKVFQDKLGHVGRSYTSEMITARNEWAHQGTFSNDQAYRIADTAARLLAAVSAPEAHELEQCKQELLRALSEEQRRRERHEESVASIELWRDYCRSVMEDHDRWTELFVPLEALRFVPAQLTPRERPRLFSAMPHWDSTFPSPQSEPALDCIRQCEGPLVILGGPGQGKTALAELLVVESSRRRLEEAGELLPVLVKMNRYDPGQQRNLRALIATSLRARGVKIDSQGIRQLLDDVDTRLLLIFDGLDEVKRAERAHVKNDLESLLLQCPAHQYVITCREAEYDQFGLQLEGVETVELDHFSEKDVRRFLIDYYWNYEQDAHKARTLFEQIEQRSLVEFVQTPLHLGLIVGIAAEEGELPASQGELYRRFVEKTLRLEGEKGTVPLEWTRIERFLAHLAWAMHRREVWRISQSEARREIGSYWRELWERGECSLPSDQVFDSVWSSRLLVKTEAEASFRHPILQEYFAAKRLQYMLEDSEMSIYQLASESHWDQVFVLLAGMVDDASALLDVVSRHARPLLALKCLNNARKVDDFSALVCIGRVTDRLSDPEYVVAHWQELIAERAQAVLRDKLRTHLIRGWTERLLPLDDVPWQMLLIYNAYGASLAEEVLLPILGDCDRSDERTTALVLLGVVGSEESVPALFRCLDDEHPEIRCAATDVLGRIGAPQAVEVLKSRLFDSDSSVHRIAITVLGALCGANVSPVPRTFLDFVRPIVPRPHRNTVQVEEIRELLRPDLLSPDEGIRTEAAIVLGCLGEAKVAGQLVEILEDSAFDLYEKGRVMRALCQVGTEDQVGSILDFTSKAEPTDFEACAALALSGYIEYSGYMEDLIRIVGYWKGTVGASQVDEDDGQSEAEWLYQRDRLRSRYNGTYHCEKDSAGRRSVVWPFSVVRGVQ